MQAQQLNKVNFDIIRYSNCWEDADVLLEGLNPQEGGRFLSIGSAGDNSFSLLTTMPEFVVAVDISEVQLFLIELKKVAIRKLSYPTFLEFLGFRRSSSRAELFGSLKNELSPKGKEFWEQNMKAIESGIIYMGKFEKYFAFFRKIIIPLIHNKRTIDRLFSEKTTVEQDIFYNEKWNTWRWRLLFKIFFSKMVMGRFGRAPEFLRQVEIPVSEYIFQKSEKHLKSTRSQNNYFLHFILTGNFGKQLPHYARPENFEIIKRNIDKLHLFHGSAEDALKEYAKINYLNLSNIFEYMDASLSKNVIKILLKKSAPDARMAYWNLMVERNIENIFPGEVTTCRKLSSRLTNIDKGFFYSQFVLNKKQDFEAREQGTNNTHLKKTTYHDSKYYK